jgi:hypothetical protein
MHDNTCGFCSADAFPLLLQTRRSMVGEGAFGTVYRAVYDGNLVAVKMVSNSKHAALLKEEAMLMATMRHPNVLPPYAFIEEPEKLTWGLVMPLYKHGSVLDAVSRHGGKPEVGTATDSSKQCSKHVLSSAQHATVHNVDTWCWITLTVIVFSFLCTGLCLMVHAVSHRRLLSPCNLSVVFLPCALFLPYRHSWHRLSACRLLSWLRTASATCTGTPSRTWT